MKRMRWIPRVAGRGGYALLTVVVLTFVLLLGGTAFFTTSSYETKAAICRQSSAEAYYLADGAIERARARFLADRAWRTGWAGQLAGQGVYGLSLTDTTYLGTPNVVRLLATGTVKNVTRRVEAMVRVPATALNLAVLIQGDASIGGNFTVNGDLHANTMTDMGHVKGEGDRTSGFDIFPPVVRTEPAFYPGTTYYYVKGVKVGSKYQAIVYDRNMNDVTATLGASMTGGMVTYNSGTKTYSYNFSGAKVAGYFSDATGKFRRDPGDGAVIVNFGASPPNPADVRSTVTVQGGSPVNVTIINTRFTGVTDADRLNPNFWFGGKTYVKQTEFEPRNGLAIIAYDFAKQGSALVQMGTNTVPAATYVTRGVSGVNSNFSAVGTVIVLGTWSSTGGPDATYTPAFIPNLPSYLQEDWVPGVSGTLEVLRWREVGA
jgi:hypothetical protein